LCRGMNRAFGALVLALMLAALPSVAVAEPRARAEEAGAVPGMEALWSRVLQWLGLGKTAATAQAAAGPYIDPDGRTQADEGPCVDPNG